MDSRPAALTQCRSTRAATGTGGGVLFERGCPPCWSERTLCHEFKHRRWDGKYECKPRAGRMGGEVRGSATVVGLASVAGTYPSGENLTFFNSPEPECTTSPATRPPASVKETTATCRATGVRPQHTQGGAVRRTPEDSDTTSQASSGGDVASGYLITRRRFVN